MRRREVAAVVVAMAMMVGSGGCATTNRSKTLLLMAGVGAAAAGVGYSVAPREERPEMHAVYWGAAGAAVAGALGLFLFDEQKRSEEMERQATVMRKELDAFRDEGGGGHEPRLLYETTAPFGKDLPGEYQSLVKPGRWSVYKLNQWVTQSEGTMIHQDRMVKLVPPQLTPKAQPISNEGIGPSEDGSGASVSTSNKADGSKERGGKGS